MASYAIGFLISTLVVIVPILVMANNRAIYISLEGFVIVIGGTIGIAVSACLASVKQSKPGNSILILNLWLCV
jgi:flagellar motor component MotA